LALDVAVRREQVLDELELLATVEHALCIEYLTIHAALGHDLGQAIGPSRSRRWAALCRRRSRPPTQPLRDWS